MLPMADQYHCRRRGGPVVECKTPEGEVGGLILTQVAVCVFEQDHIYLPKSTGNTQDAVALSRHD